MQRAEARKPTEKPAPSSSSSSPSTIRDDGQPKQTKGTTSNTKSGKDDQPEIVVEDGNPEHWSFASSSRTQPTRPASPDADDDESTSLGWNSWLLSAGATSRSKKRKSGDENGLRSIATNQETPFAGRRTFGTFPGQEEEEEDEGVEEPEDHEVDESGTSKRKQKDGRSRLRRSGSLEPDVNFDSKGQLSIREKSKKARKVEKGGSKKGRLR